jgi:hypothetical protein
MEDRRQGLASGKQSRYCLPLTGQGGKGPSDGQN